MRSAAEGRLTARLYSNRMHVSTRRPSCHVVLKALNGDVRGADSTGVITFRGRKINVSRALADADIALEEVDEGIWRVWYIVTPLGHFDERRWQWVHMGNSLD